MKKENPERVLFLCLRKIFSFKNAQFKYSIERFFFDKLKGSK